MKKIISLLINIQILVLTSYTSITAQNYSVNEITKYSKTIVNQFERLENIPNKNQTPVNFFPNNNGDFWEFIEEDTTTLFGQNYTLKFSISRVVIDDTILNNGFTYKKIKWQNEANSVNYPPEYEHLRIDSIGNAHIFYDTTDYILFNFTLDINQTYPSHLLNHEWKVMDKYYVIAFGDTLQAIDFGLYDQNNNWIEIYTIVENFGIIFYQKDLLNYALPIGNFWGAVINGQEYGTLIVKKKTVDWKQFYPLHIGDYWVYEGFSGSIPVTKSVRVIGDTIMPNGYSYSILKTINHTFGNTSISYWRIDSLGILSYWDTINISEKVVLRFSVVVGDTLTLSQLQYVKRLDDKYINPVTGSEELHFFMYPDLVFDNEYYDYSFGLYSSVIEFNYSVLRGACINGVTWGDTIITSIENNIVLNPQSIDIFPCYPNPFNSSTTLTYYIPAATDVRISLYNTLGELTEILFDDNLNSGYHRLVINAAGLVSGVYFIVFNADDIQLVSKIIYLK
ncbi:MAG: T9SS type A sorting domain-containing protein [Ignavibacteriaceae bacterium]